MRLWFSGSRQGMTTIQRNKILEFLKENKDKIKEIHHGDEIGAEQLFHTLCFENDLMDKIIIHPLNNRKYRALCKAPIIHKVTNHETRKKNIVSQTNFLLVATDSYSNNIRSGCWSLVKIAQAYNLSVLIIFPNGTATTIKSKQT